MNNIEKAELKEEQQRCGQEMAKQSQKSTKQATKKSSHAATLLLKDLILLYTQ